MKILLIKQTSLGDLIHATLALEAIKIKWPQAEIHFMVDKACAFAVENNPHIDKFYYYDQQNYFKRLRQSKLSIFSIARDILKTLGQIRKTRFDLAFDLQGRERSAFFLYFCKASQKFIKGNFLFLKGFKNANKDDHALAELRGVLKLADIDAETCSPRIYINPASRTSLQEKLPEEVLSIKEKKAGKIVVISPFTSWKTKDLPVSTYLKTAEKISLQYPESVFFFTGTKDVYDKIQQDFENFCSTENKNFQQNCFNYAGKTDIQELLALIDLADLVLASEGAAAHMASALQTALAVIFGPTKPSRVGPWGENSLIIQDKNSQCLGCYKRTCDNFICMNIPPEEIAESALELLQKTKDY